MGMTSTEILALVVTAIGVISFAAIFTILYMSFAKSTISEIKSGKRDIELLDEVIYEQQTHVKRKKEITGTIKSVIFFTFIALVTPLFVISLINKLAGDVIPLGNRSIMIVASGSMSEIHESDYELKSSGWTNQFKQYDMIVIEKVNPSSLKIGDVIAFKNSKGENIIHRIRGIDWLNGGFITQGDAVGKPDGFNPTRDQVIGKYISKRIPLVGIFIIFFQSPAGIVTVLSLLYCMIMIDTITKKIDKAQLKRVEKLAAALDYKDEKNAKSFNAKYLETIYYKGVAYHFNEEGFLDKEDIEDESYLEKSEDAIIKVVEDEATKEIVSEVVISTDEKVEEASTTENIEDKKGEDNA